MKGTCVMRAKAIFFVLACLALSGCSDDEAVVDQMNPTSDGDYIIVRQTGEVTFRSIVNGKSKINLEAEWRGEVPSGMAGRQDFLIVSTCGEMILSHLDGRFFIDALLLNSERKKIYDGCGLGEVHPATWQIVSEPAA